MKLIEKTEDFARLIVTLLVYERHSAGIGLWNASGFPIEVNGQWWLVTAGHVINALRQLNSAGNLDRLSICDAWAGPNGHGYPIPFPAVPENWYAHGEDDDSVDLGAIKLTPNTVEMLKAGKTEVVSETEWRNTPIDFDRYFLLGTPREMINTYPPQGLPTELSVVRGLFHLTKVHRPDDAKVTTHDRFYGRINKVGDEKVVLEKIEGVSGGAVLGGRDATGGIEVWVLAIQSAWLRGEKTITADYLITLGNALAALAIK